MLFPGIVEEVRRGTDPPFRPTVPKDACSPALHQLMSSCLREVPEKRPDFNSVKSELKKMNRWRDSSQEKTSFNSMERRKLCYMYRTTYIVTFISLYKHTNTHTYAHIHYIYIRAHIQCTHTHTCIQCTHTYHMPCHRQIESFVHAPYSILSITRKQFSNIS